MVFFIISTLLLFSSSLPTLIATTLPVSPPPEPPSPPPPPFNPSMAVVVGVLTTLFSITFLLLMYAKHCKGSSLRAPTNVSSYNGHSYYNPGTGRKNSGIDPVVIESLPVFRFGSLQGGQKDGLECAVCLTRFDPAELLRLLPKCRHAFHVECVDTWLDAHSTCPLCRFRVDPEDILIRVDLGTDTNHLYPSPPQPPPLHVGQSTHRVSGRHSSVGELGTINNNGVNCTHLTTSSRRSLDESLATNIDRKDGMLMNTTTSTSGTDRRRVLEHRIIISEGNGGTQFERWSDVQPRDLFYLRSEMLMNEGRRSSSSKGVQARVHGNHGRVRVQGIDEAGVDGRSVINGRSVSEITGLSRLMTDHKMSSSNRDSNEERHKGVVSRWTAWISQSRPGVRSAGT